MQDNDAGADLIVIAPHGRTGLRWALIGSIAEGTVRHAMCPVLVVPSLASPRRSGLRESTRRSSPRNAKKSSTQPRLSNNKAGHIDDRLTNRVDQVKKPYGSSGRIVATRQFSPSDTTFRTLTRTRPMSQVVPLASALAGCAVPYSTTRDHCGALKRFSRNVQVRTSRGAAHRG